MVRRLEYLQDVVVGRRQHRRSFVAPHEATLLQAARLVTVEDRVGPAARQMLAGDETALLALLRSRRERRNPAVRRVDDQRRPQARQPLAALLGQPDRVVVVDVLLRLDGLLPAQLGIRLGEGGPRQRVDAVHGEQGAQFRGLLLRQECSVAESLRALQRRERRHGPLALQVGPAVRGARRHVRVGRSLLALTGGRRRPEPRGGEQGDECEACAGSERHLKLLGDEARSIPIIGP